MSHSTPPLSNHNHIQNYSFLMTIPNGLKTPTTLQWWLGLQFSSIFPSTHLESLAHSTDDKSMNKLHVYLSIFSKITIKYLYLIIFLISNISFNLITHFNISKA